MYDFDVCKYFTVCLCTIFVYLDCPRKLKRVLPEHIASILAPAKTVVISFFQPTLLNLIVVGRERFGVGISSPCIIGS